MTPPDLISQDNGSIAPIPRTVVVETEEPIVVQNGSPLKAYLIDDIVNKAEEDEDTPTVTTTTLAADSASLVSSTATSGEMVVLVDPLSTGVLLQKRLIQSGYRIILVWSDRTKEEAQNNHYVKTGKPKDSFVTVIQHQADRLEDTLDGIVAAAGSFPISAVMCGSEFGVMLEDMIAEGLRERARTSGPAQKKRNYSVRSSGMKDPIFKVDKHAQATIIRDAGLNAVHEKLAFSEEDVASFLADHASQSAKDGTFAIVAKPQTGSGSVGVMFCTSEEQVWDAFHKIMAGQHKAHCSGKYKHYSHAGVLLQEYLAGIEYIVNLVVLNGVPKTTALFKYDKRPYNGAPFVCFSKELLVIGDEPHLTELVDYTENVIQALGFRNGALHAEVMYTKRGPVLVEMNCRLHGGNAAWVRPAEMCMGYSQLGVFMDAYLSQGENDFAAIQSRPQVAYKRCHQVKMRTRSHGTLVAYDAAQLNRIRALPSYLEHFFSVHPGDTLLKTIDMPSVPGEVTLVHHDKDQLTKDYNTLNEILHEGIFVVA